MKFEKRVSPTIFGDLEWLASALRTDDSRFHVTTIWVRDDGSALATDGSRMHVVNQFALSPGFYKVVKKSRWAIEIDKVSEEDTFDFPRDCDDIIAGKHGNGHMHLDIDPDKSEAGYAQLIRLMADNYIQYNLFMDAVAGFEGGNVLVRFDEDCKHPFYFMNDDWNRDTYRLAIVMPFRI
jgi:hypothetical protein